MAGAGWDWFLTRVAGLSPWSSSWRAWRSIRPGAPQKPLSATATDALIEAM